jgi:hypothetical protein
LGEKITVGSIVSSFDAGDNEEEDPDDFVVYSCVPCDTLQKREKVTVGGGECVSNVQVSSACPRFIFCRRRENTKK